MRSTAFLRRRCSAVVFGLLAAVTAWQPLQALPDPPSLQVIVSVRDRMLWVIDGVDTLKAARVARTHNLEMRQLSAAGTRLRDGSLLTARDSVVGIELASDSTFHALPIDEHIVFDSTLFIPPVGSRNRQLAGELGRFALDLGDGYLLHGTRDQDSIASQVTPGCIRLADDDLAWLFENVPIGTRVRVR